MGAVAEEDDRYLTLQQAADYTGVVRRTIERWMRWPEPLPTFRIGSRILIRKSELDAWIAKVGRQTASPEPARVDPRVAEVVASIRGSR
jgi:excisionase family DNA binding protein